MATYKQIQEYVKQTYGYVPKSCWIAHMKEACGLKPKVASNRSGDVRMYPCPLEKQADIRETFQHFKML
ncbi:hypothetical protein C8Z91_02145 [Paenibacillus elgii]|uniref:RNA methyltransferase n=1 Tax=Paenibacillus elgii TaxID=189691 RepID=A0A2T6G911_9BACL|nr:hypothetical protein [Paenibacillus elgii]PUA40653.1 hypothetical protein C8Z91_02145 [Paenibacillus elgii]